MALAEIGKFRRLNRTFSDLPQRSRSSLQPPVSSANRKMSDALTFDPAPPWVIREIKQRELLNAWLSLHAKSSGKPEIAAFAPERIGDEVRNMGRYAVVRGGDHVRFFIENDGSHLALAFGSSGKGKFIDEYVTRDLVEKILINYRACVDFGMPVYVISELVDHDNRSVSYERLLLPFFTGAEVSHIITHLRMISADGRFEVRELMNGAGGVPRYRLAVRIAPVTEPRRPRCAAPADEIVVI
jgi:hypothetical protein